MINPTKFADNARPLTIAQLIVNIFGLALLGIGFLGLSTLLLIAPIAQEFPLEQSNQLRSMLWIIFAAALLTIPSLVSSIRRLSGKPAGAVPRGLFLTASIALLLAAPLVFLGNRLAASGGGQWAFGLFNVLVVFIPLWWFLEFGRSRLAGGSKQRQWGVITSSFFITLPVIIVVEIVVLAAGVLLTALWLVQQPEFALIFQQIEQGLSSGSFNPQNLSIDWLPLLQQPIVIAAIVIGASLIVPLIEELIKPLAVWSLSKRDLTPAGGFIAGMLCGGAFALLESLFSLSAASGNDWLFTVAGRVGTGLLHLTLSAFNGWALASSWKDGNFLRVGLTYIITVVLHGTWNLFALLMGLNMAGNELLPNVNSTLSASAPWVLFALALGMLAALFMMNLRLRSSTKAPALAPPPPLPITPGGIE